MKCELMMSDAMDCMMEERSNSPQQLRESFGEELGAMMCAAPSMGAMSSAAPVLASPTLPSLDTLLNCFNAEGLFEAKHMQVLLSCVPDSTQTELKLLLLKADAACTEAFLLSTLALMVLSECFLKRKGEWELIAKKTRKILSGQKSPLIQKVKQMDVQSDEQAMLARLMAL